VNGEALAAEEGKGASLMMRYRLPRNSLSDGDAFPMDT
jgi:hypothetical protein